MGLNVKPEIVKLLKEKLETIFFFQIGVDDSFLNITKNT